MEKSIETLEEFLCPITQQQMENPVIAEDGHSYEKNAIETWFNSGNKTSPLTGEELNPKFLKENLTLRKIINSFQENSVTNEKACKKTNNDFTVDNSVTFNKEKLQNFKKLEDDVINIKSDVLEIKSFLLISKEEIFIKFEELMKNKAPEIKIENEFSINKKIDAAYSHIDNFVKNENETNENDNNNKNINNNNLINQNEIFNITKNENENKNMASINNNQNTNITNDIQTEHIIEIYPISEITNETTDENNKNHNINNKLNINQNNPKTNFFKNIANKILIRKIPDSHDRFKDTKTFNIENKQVEIEHFLPIKDSFLASYSTKKRTIEIWDLNNKNKNNKNNSLSPIKTLEVHLDNVLKIINLSNGNFASCSADKTIKIWSKENLNCLKTFKGHEASVKNLIELSDKKIISCSDDGVVKIWDLPILSANCKFSFEAHQGPILNLFELADGSICTVGAKDKKIKIWNITTQNKNCLLLKTFLTQKEFSNVIKINHGFLLKLVCCDSQEIKIIDLSYGYYIGISNEFTSQINNLINLQNGNFATSAINQPTIRIWNVSNGECVDSFAGHSRNIKRMFLIDDKKKLISYADDNDFSVRIWEISSAECVVLEGFKRPVKAVVYLNAGKIVCFCKDDLIPDNASMHVRDYRNLFSLGLMLLIFMLILIVIVLVVYFLKNGANLLCNNVKITIESNKLDKKGYFGLDYYYYKVKNSIY